MGNKVSLFLDSGAFSAWTQSIEIDINDYIAFIKQYEQYINCYSVLDSIMDPEKTLENQKIMEKAGLKPLPCFHYGEDIKYLKYYLENYKYISLGGMVPISTKDLIPWLDNIFMNYICNNETGIPKHKIHGFGIASLSLVFRYPWYSIDSTSWVMTSRFGAVLIPKRKKDIYIYGEEPWKITFSLKSSSQKEEGKHYKTLTEMERKEIDKYLEMKGFSIGDSKIRREERKKYKLKEGEKWFGKEDADGQRSIYGTKERKGYVTTGSSDGDVETVITLGLCNDYKLRDELNIIYYQDLQESITKWPWPFKQSKQTKFGFMQ